MFGAALNAVDSVLAFLPYWARVTFWAAALGVGTMLMYGAFSDQQRLNRLKEESKAARRALQSYEGTDFSKLWELMRESLALSTRQMKHMLGPTMLAGIPVIMVMIWMDGAYRHRLPEPGASVDVQTVMSDGADTSRASWQPASARLSDPRETDAGFGTELRWPGAGGEPAEQVRLTTQGRDAPLLSLPLEHPRASVGKYWWGRAVFANPAGYLPDDGPVEQVRLELPQREYLPFGPGWLRGWEALFLIAISVAAGGTKWAFGID